MIIFTIVLRLLCHTLTTIAIITVIPQGRHLEGPQLRDDPVRQARYVHRHDPGYSNNSNNSTNVIIVLT